MWSAYYVHGVEENGGQFWKRDETAAISNALYFSKHIIVIHEPEVPVSRNQFTIHSLIHTYFRGIRQFTLSALFQLAQRYILENKTRLPLQMRIMGISRTNISTFSLIPNE